MGPSSLLPSNIFPEGSILKPLSLVRHTPSASKFSSEKPIGSIIEWQDLHGSLVRCCCIRSRTERALATWPVRCSEFSGSGGTLGGGGGGGVPSKTCIT